MSDKYGAKNVYLEDASVASVAYDDGRRKLVLLVKHGQEGVIAKFDTKKDVQFVTYSRYGEPKTTTLKPTGLGSWATDINFYQTMKVNGDKTVKVTLVVVNKYRTLS
ncbi:hypothetical protein [Vibrio neonatus]|uniref:hypothetical protein n=1 Tax=Vibrio neonatus TaxID=278860 RepID=UPI0021C38789|nr:hypothetical protein [Vibrio neonatus]